MGVLLVGGDDSAVLRSTGALDQVEQRIASTRDEALAVLRARELAGGAAEGLRALALAATDRSA